MQRPAGPGAALDLKINLPHPAGQVYATEWKCTPHSWILDRSWFLKRLSEILYLVLTRAFFSVVLHSQQLLMHTLMNAHAELLANVLKTSTSN